MAEIKTTRRSFTDAQRLEVAEYAQTHGVNAAGAKFNINSTQVTRWRTQLLGKKIGRKVKWTPERIAEVLEFLKTHTHKETKEHFRIGSGQISIWRRGLSRTDVYQMRKAKQVRRMTRTGNGADLPHSFVVDERAALMWLERWRQAYLDRIKAETPLAADVLLGLRMRGGK